MLACGFQFAKEDAFEQLVDAHYSTYSAEIKRIPARTFLHLEDMPADLLVAIWGPVALNALKWDVDVRGGWGDG